MTTTTQPKDPDNLSDEKIRNFLRQKLSGETLDELFEEARTCGHEGTCWDLVNKLADIITPITKALLHQQVEAQRHRYEQMKGEK